MFQTTNLNINQLNFDCFSLILGRVSLVDLIKNCMLVCGKWKFVVQEYVCPQKKSLKIYSRETLPCVLYDVDGCTHLQLYDDILLFDNLKPLTCQSICNTFPNVDILALKIDITTQDLICFLSAWKSLKSLSLFESLQSDNRQYIIDWKLVWPLVQQQKSLIDLHLCKTYLHHFIEDNNLDLTIFNQLEELELGSDKISHQNNNQFIEILNNLDQNKILYLLLLDFQRVVDWRPLGATQKSYENVLELNISTNLKAPVEFNGRQSTLLDYICLNFISLTTLDIDIDGETLIEDMLKYLVNLNSLERLAIRSTEFVFKNITRQNMHQMLIPLPSVRELVVNFYIAREHFDYLCAVFTNIVSFRTHCFLIDCYCISAEANGNNLSKKKQSLVDKYSFWCLHKCPESTQPAFSRFNQLSLVKLTFYGDYCPNLLINEFQCLEKITTFDFSSCKSFRVKLLFHCLSGLAARRSTDSFKLIIHLDKFALFKNNRLWKEKPPNLSIVTTKTFRD